MNMYFGSDNIMGDIILKQLKQDLDDIVGADIYCSYDFEDGDDGDPYLPTPEDLDITNIFRF